MKTSKIKLLPLSFPINKVRATYILRKEDIQKLRKVALAKNPTLIHLSSFTITTAYVWACLAKSSAESGEAVDDDEPEYFSFPVDVRSRMDPPAPANYFGNCLAGAMVETTHGKLKGEEGFSTAVELIGEVISKKVNKKGEILRRAAHWLEKREEMVGKRFFGVAGSPKFDLYGTDFGWGKPTKYEAASIDRDGCMSFCKSREFEGGLEIGLSMPVKKMNAFGAIFSAELKNISA